MISRTLEEAQEAPGALAEEFRGPLESNEARIILIFSLESEKTSLALFFSFRSKRASEKHLSSQEPRGGDVKKQRAIPTELQKKAHKKLPCERGKVAIWWQATAALLLFFFSPPLSQHQNSSPRPTPAKK